MRGRLLTWLVVTHLLALAATAWFAYVLYGRLVNNFMDDQMQLVAESHATHHRLPALAPVSREQALRLGTFVVQIWSADGHEQLASSWPGLAVPLQSATGFGLVRTGPGAQGQWRVYTVSAAADADAAETV